MAYDLGEETKTVTVTLGANYSCFGLADFDVELYWTDTNGCSAYDPKKYEETGFNYEVMAGNGSFAVTIPGACTVSGSVSCGKNGTIRNNENEVTCEEMNTVVTMEKDVSFDWLVGSVNGTKVLGHLDYINNAAQHIGNSLSGGGTLTVDINITYQKYGEFVDTIAQDNIYIAYPHYDPSETPTRVWQIYYVVTGVSVHYTASSGEEDTISMFSGTSDKIYGALFTASGSIGDSPEYHLPAYLLHTPGLKAIHKMETQSEAAFIAISGSNIGNTTISRTDTYPNADAELAALGFESCWVMENGRISLSHNGGGMDGHTGNAGIDMSVPAFDVSYTGTVKDCNDTARSGVTLNALDFASVLHGDLAEASTSSAGYAEIKREYAGVFTVRGWKESGGDPSRNDGPGAYFGISGIKNPFALEEFNYDQGIVPAGTMPAYGEFGDVAVRCLVNELAWSNACTLTIASNKQRIAFAEVTGWVVSPTGKATLSVVNGALQVVVGDTDVTLTKTYTSPQPELSGARYVNLDYDNPTTDAVGININSAVAKDVKPATATTKNSETIDLVGNCVNEVETDDNQNLAFGAFSGFGLGIGKVNTIVLSKLKAGKTYTFRGLTQVISGVPATYIFDGAFIGNRPNHPRTDDHDMYSDPRQTGTVIKNRHGYVICDGILLAEIYGMNHLQQGSKWLAQPIPIADSDVIYPTDGLVSFAVIPAAGKNASEYYTCDILPGVHNGTSVSLSIIPRVTHISVPHTSAHSFSFRKQLRGNILAKVFNKDGSPYSGSVTCKLHDWSNVSDAPISTESKDVSDGILLLQQVQAPCMDKGIVVSISSDGLTVTAKDFTTDRNYAGHMIYMAPPDNSYEPEYRTIDAITYSNGTATITLHTALNQTSNIYTCWISKDYIYEILAPGENGDISGTVSARNRGIAFLTIKGAVISSISGLSVFMSEGSMCVYAVFVKSDGIYLRIYYTNTKNYTERKVSSVIPLCVSGTIEACRVEYIVIVYEESGVIKSTQSANHGVGWSNPVTLWNGKNPQIAYSEHEKAEIIAYIADKGSSNYSVFVRRKLGTSTAYDAAVEVCSCDDKTLVDITYAPRDKGGLWILLVKTDTGDLHRYISHNIGRSWTLDE